MNYHRTIVLRAGAAGAVLITLLGACATKSNPPSLAPEQQELNVDSFDYVWTTIRDKHYDPDLSGVDWPAVREELRPKVEQASTMTEVRSVLRDMMGRLEQSHFGIIPAEAYENLPTGEGEARRSGTTGIDARVVEGRALVTSVRPDSPAAEAGVRPGWEITRVEQNDVRSKLESLALELDEGPSKPALLSNAVRSGLRGIIGDSVTIDTTVQEKKVTYPTDSKLLYTAMCKLGQAAGEREVIEKDDDLMAILAKAERLRNQQPQDSNKLCGVEVRSNRRSDP